MTHCIKCVCVFVLINEHDFLLIFSCHSFIPRMRRDGTGDFGLNFLEIEIILQRTNFLLTRKSNVI